MPRPRDASIDRRIIDACVELLEEVGRPSLSRERIARRAGVSLPAVNRRYADVDEILLDLMRTPAHTEPPQGVDSLRSHLVAVLRRGAAYLAAQPARRASAEILAAAAGSEVLRETFEGTVAQVREEGHRWVEHARAAGHVRADADADLLLDLVSGALYYRLLWRGELLADEEVEPLVDTILAGFRPAGTGGP
jgi:AcrR family transcriptional regulator